MIHSAHVLANMAGEGPLSCKDAGCEGLPTPYYSRDGIMIARAWAMPSVWTFSIQPIGRLIQRYIAGQPDDWVDPFAGTESPARVTNDIEGRGARYQMDALDFLRSLPGSSAAGVLFDPPYSVEQCLRRYTPKQGGTAGRAEYWARCKDEITRIVRAGGVVISCCWDSTGMGAKRGFAIEEILLVCHGACHNDTIVTVDRKAQEVLL
jgi:hypothetical protein